MNRNELIAAIKHRLKQSPKPLQFVLMPKEWIEEAVALLEAKIDLVERDGRPTLVINYEPFERGREEL
jgi:hypothetical protein